MTEPRGTQAINMDRFVTIAVQMLDNYFFKENKNKARKLYKEVEEGKVVGVATVGFEQNRDAKIRVKLALDHSEFRGHLTFHLFRQALDVMLKNIAARLRAEKPLNMFTSEETGEVLFNIPGLVEDRGELNVLMMGLQASEGTVVIRLQFLDPDQFKKPSDSVEEETTREE